MEKTINIQNKAIINGIGNLNNRKCKPVICIDTGEVFTSAFDAAETIGVHFSAMSAVCRGKIKTVKGKHYCYLSDATENLDAIVTRLRETSTLEADARKWQAYQAEQEAARKAEEKRKADIAKAEEKLARCKEICKRLEAELQRATERVTETEKELNALKGINNQEVA